MKLEIESEFDVGSEVFFSESSRTEPKVVTGEVICVVVRKTRNHIEVFYEIKTIQGHTTQRNEVFATAKGLIDHEALKLRRNLAKQIGT